MNVSRNLLVKTLGIVLTVALAAVGAFAQQSRGTLRGVVSDELGGTVTGATVTLTDAAGTEKTSITNGEGVYVFSGLAPGKYFVSVNAPGFAVSDDSEVDITPAVGRLWI